MEDATGTNAAVVLNYVKGTIFNCIPLAVILKGVANAINEDERSNLTRKFGQALTPATVQADFNPPLIVVGSLKKKKILGIFPWLLFNAGPKSNVILDTPYLSENLRLGVGARGSTFVFKRLSDDDDAATDYISATEHLPLSQLKLSIRLLTFGASMFALSLISVGRAIRTILRLIALPSFLLAAGIGLGKGLKIIAQCILLLTITDVVYNPCDSDTSSKFESFAIAVTDAITFRWN